MCFCSLQCPLTAAEPCWKVSRRPSCFHQALCAAQNSVSPQPWAVLCFGSPTPGCAALYRLETGVLAASSLPLAVNLLSLGSHAGPRAHTAVLSRLVRHEAKHTVWEQILLSAPDWLWYGDAASPGVQFNH